MHQRLSLAPALTSLGLAASGCMPSYATRTEAPVPRPCAEAATAAVAWYFPGTSGDNERLERWCAAVGPVVLQSEPSATFGPLAAGDTVRVAVWNTDAGAGHLVAFLQEALGLRCAGASSSRGPGAPHAVILIQEALRRSNDIPDVPKSRVTPPPVKEEPHPGPRLDVVEVAVRCGLAHFYVPAARNDWRQRDGKREDKGNAILATVPLADPIVAELPFEAARRVVPFATIHGARGDSLRLASVHLITTPPPARALLTGGSSRLRQALGLLEVLRHIERDRADLTAGAPSCPGSCTIPTIIAGDLNTWSNRETTLRDLRDAFPDSPAPLAEPTRGPFPTDHLLFRRAAGSGVSMIDGSYRRIDDAHYSDHHPVVAMFSFGP